MKRDYFHFLILKRYNRRGLKLFDFQAVGQMILVIENTFSYGLKIKPVADVRRKMQVFRIEKFWRGSGPPT